MPNVYYRDDIGERWSDGDGDRLQAWGYLGPAGSRGDRRGVGPRPTPTPVTEPEHRNLQEMSHESMDMPQLAHERDLLQCRRCGTTVPEGEATRDGWTYRCPQPDCDASGLGDGLRYVDG